MKMGLGVTGSPANYQQITPLEVEMRICAEYLHSTHEEFCNLSIDERLKWILYDEMQMGRANYFNKKRELELKEKQSRKKPKVRSGRVKELK